MTLSSTQSRVSYAGNGVTTVFSFPYYFLQDEDLVVILRNDTTGVEVTKTLTTHYTVSDEGNPSGGSVTMLTPPASGETLTIYRDPEATQDLDLVENDPLPAETVEEKLDKLTMLIQRLIDRADRTVALSPGFADTFDPSLPELLEPGHGIAVNEDGDGFETGPSALDVANAGANAAAAAASAAAAAASAAAAAAVASSALWLDVAQKAFADSPISVVQANAGTMFEVDCTGGNVVINLPTIAGLDLTYSWAIGVKKKDSSVNTVTINRGGSDNIQNGTSLVIYKQNNGYVLIPDTDGSPDNWTAAEITSTEGLNAAVVTKTADYTVLVSDDTILVNAAAATAAINITLPLSATAKRGKRFKVMKIDKTTWPVNILRSGSDTFMEETSQVLLYEGQSMIFEADGSSEYRIF